MVVLLIYIDYLVITSSYGPTIIDNVSTLCFTFTCRDLGTPDFFLNMKATQQFVTLHLSQLRYMVDLF